MANTPVNVSDLRAGDTVRIQLVGPFVFFGVGQGQAVVVANQRPLGFRRSSVVGMVLRNDFQNRQLTVDYTDLTRTDIHFVADVPYGRCHTIEKQIAGTYVSDNVHRLRIPAYVPVLGVF